MKEIKFKCYLLSFLLLLAFNLSASEANSTSANVDASYVIGPGDVLSISVCKEEGMQLEVLVRPDGGIT